MVGRVEFCDDAIADDAYRSYESGDDVDADAFVERSCWRLELCSDDHERRACCVYAAGERTGHERGGDRPCMEYDVRMDGCSPRSDEHDR